MTAANKEKAAPKTAFKPGKSGNPGGRPKKTEEERSLEAMCRERTPEALATILSIMTDSDNDRNKLTAAQFIIERGWGKATQAMELTGKDGGAIEASLTVIHSPEEAYLIAIGGRETKK